VTGWDEVRISLREDTAAWVILHFDDDGTPTYMGERLTEGPPGRWSHPDAVAIREFLNERFAPCPRREVKLWKLFRSP